MLRSYFAPVGRSYQRTFEHVCVAPTFIKVPKRLESASHSASKQHLMEGTAVKAFFGLKHMKNMNAASLH